MNKKIATALFTASIAVMTSLSANATQPIHHHHNTNKNSAVSADSLLRNIDKFVGKTVIVEGICSHLCPHGETKMFVKSGNNKKFLRVEAGDFGKFKKESVRNNVSIKGVVKEVRIDNEYIDNLLKEATDDDCAGCDDSAIRKRVSAYRAMIDKRSKEEGKNYLSSYYLQAESYKIK